MIIPNANSSTLLPITKARRCPDSIVYTDSFASYDVPDVREFRLCGINHSRQFVDNENKRNHINGIENFGGQTKRHLRKFNGIPKAHY